MDSAVNVLFFLALLIGVAAGTAIVVRSPTFWASVGLELGKKVFTAIINLELFKRMSAENEKKKNDAYARGEEFVKHKRKNPDQKW